MLRIGIRVMNRAYMGSTAFDKAPFLFGSRGACVLLYYTKKP
jgi:hypothetical protein